MFAFCSFQSCTTATQLVPIVAFLFYFPVLILVLVVPIRMDKALHYLLLQGVIYRLEKKEIASSSFAKAARRWPHFWLLSSPFLMVMRLVLLVVVLCLGTTTLEVLLVVVLCYFYFAEATLYQQEREGCKIKMRWSKLLELGRDMFHRTWGGIHE